MSSIMLEFCHYSVCKRIRFRIILCSFNFQSREVQLPKYRENGSCMVRCCAGLSCSVMSDSFRPHGPARLLFPWGSPRQEYWSELPYPPWILYCLSHPGKPKNTEVDSLSLLLRISPSQGSNQGLLHCTQIVYQLSYQGSHKELKVKFSNFSLLKVDH